MSVCLSVRPSRFAYIQTYSPGVAPYQTRTTHLSFRWRRTAR